MSIIHISQIEAKLKSLFENLIDISDFSNKPPSDQESLFLTRALAAFAILAMTDITPEQAAACITDGYQDNGLDAIYFDELEKTLFLVQAKWHKDGKGSIDSGDSHKFIQGIKDILDVRFDRFNKKIKNRWSEIDKAMNNTETRFVMLLAHTGAAKLSPEIEIIFNDFMKEINDSSDVIELQVLQQKDLYSVIKDGLGKPINLEVVLKEWGQIKEPFLAYYGRVASSDVAKWWNDYHPRLFDKNIRSFLKTEINQGIIESLSSEPENFWYLNNGITALCKTIKKKPIGGSSNDSSTFVCEDVTIVNGAQTVGAIAAANAKSPENVERATVMIKFISLENCPEDFARRVTRTTNTQNRIENRDFVSLDPEQERLQNELKIDGIDYVYKAGYGLPDTNKGFNLTEATVALACYSKLSYAVQAKSGIGALWEDVTKEPYKALFNPSLSSLKLWRLVQVHREIEKSLELEKNNLQGKEAKLPVHGNRFLARQVFNQLTAINFNDPKKSVEPLISEVPEVTHRVVELTISAINELYPDSYIANLFKNVTKCQEIEDWIKSHWT
ncbi:AIPR family protein [Ancylothrix sp. C2]|uniref:AIPR family protein n=1 Tax=Ancylothrix sp. D3o TaxID=2953691 RepID=UPI0021BB7087|nr:AIPR family protein [Ancylothrix sp. D3o]MCT7951653.1 AIPR family protein [Ancylothrix sp. D3o]